MISTPFRPHHKWLCPMSEWLQKLQKRWIWFVIQEKLQLQNSCLISQGSALLPVGGGLFWPQRTGIYMAFQNRMPHSIQWSFALHFLVNTCKTYLWIYLVFKSILALSPSLSLIYTYKCIYICISYIYIVYYIYNIIYIYTCKYPISLQLMFVFPLRANFSWLN